METMILEKIQEADMVLVGLGEEFNTCRYLFSSKEREIFRKMLEESGNLWMFPVLNIWQTTKKAEEMMKGLSALAEILQNKNYFVVSVAQNEAIEEVAWKQGRLVMPCGSSRKKQCRNGCRGVLADTSCGDREAIERYLGILRERMSKEEKNTPKIMEWDKQMGICPECGEALVLNNIYAENYNESGYLEQWQLYTKWLQGTLNRKMLILELGVGMKFPGVIRWPFEKIAYFQQKAEFYRVNENLYQMSEELKGKGKSISKNAIDWLLGLC